MSENKLETFRTRGSNVAVKGEDFKVTVQPDGCVVLNFDGHTKHIDWIFNEREKKTAKPEEESR